MLYAIIILITFICPAFADVTVTEHCVHETKLIQDKDGNYTVVVDPVETCVSGPGNWKDS